MKKILLGTTSLLIAATVAMPAQAGDISVSTSIDYVTEYIFRGVTLESGAIQPGVEVALDDFSVGVWASTGLGSDSLADTDEVDFYAGYSLGLSETLSASFGGTWYHYPDAQDTFEVNAGLSLDSILSPSVTAYYDFTLEGFTLEGGVSHSLPVAEKTSIDLGLTVGLVTAENDVNWEYGTASAALGYGFTDDVSAYLGANYTLSSSDDEGLGIDFDEIIQGNPQSDLLWFGIGVAAGF